jgi:hypothetical protein
MCELDFVKVGAFIGFTVTLIALCYVMYHYLQGGFKSKDKPIPKEGYNEHNLPKGCELIQFGDKYMFKIKDKFANMDDYGYFLWSSNYVQAHGTATDKEFAIKRGIETFEFFKALGKI